MMEPASATRGDTAVPESTSETRATAARLGALLTHVFLFDRGGMLRTLEDSGLSLPQCKTLLALAGPGESVEPRQIGEIAERLGVSLPTISRAVDGLVRKRLVTRVEDEQDRRVRRIAITAKGERLVGTFVSIRLASLEAFASSLTAAQRRKLDTALESLLEREEIATTYSDLKEVSPS